MWALKWEVCLRVWSLLHIYLLLNCVHKYIAILYVYSSGSLICQWCYREWSLLHIYPSELCSQIHRHLGWHIGLRGP